MTTTTTPASHDIALTPNVTLRHIAMSGSSSHVFLLEVQGQPLCFVHGDYSGVQCKTLDLQHNIGGGSNYSAAVGRALHSASSHARNQAKHWADEMVTRTDPVKRSEARGQLELAVAQHDMLQREIDAIHAALNADHQEQEAQEQRAPVENDTPF